MEAHRSRMGTKVLVRDVMNSPVITVSPDEKVDAVARKMVDLEVGSIVVSKNEAPIGIITDGDLVSKVVAKNLLPSKLKAHRIMSSPIETIESMKDLPEAARLMRKKNIKRMGVVRNGILVGMVSISDLLAVTPELIDVLSEKARIMTGESRRVQGDVEGYCDNCGRWSESLQEIDSKYICEECRQDSSGELPAE